MPTCPNGHVSETDAKFCIVCGDQMESGATALLTDPSILSGSQAAPSAGASPPNEGRGPLGDGSSLAADDNADVASAEFGTLRAAAERVGGLNSVSTELTEPMAASGSIGFPDGSTPLPLTESLAAGAGTRPREHRPTLDPVDLDSAAGEVVTKARGGKAKGIAVAVLIIVLLLAGGAIALASRHTASPAANHTTSSTTSTTSTTITSTTSTTTSTTSTSTTGVASTTVASPTASGDWTYPQKIDQTAFQNSSAILNNVSCPQEYQCYAADSAGNILYSSGKTSQWRIVDSDSAGITGISCPTRKFCVAVDGNGSAIFGANGSWSDPISVDGAGGGVKAISCPSTTLCLAPDSNGNVAEFMGDEVKWTVASSVDPDATLTDISCPTSSFCAMTDDAGDVLTWNGQRWSAAHQVTSQLNGEYGSLTAISCATASFCGAVDGDQNPSDGGGYAVTYNGSGWSPKLVAVNAPLDAIACPAVGICIAADDAGGVRMFQDGKWSHAAQNDGDNPYVSIACSTSSSCVAFDNQDNVLYFSSPTA